MKTQFVGCVKGRVNSFTASTQKIISRNLDKVARAVAELELDAWLKLKQIQGLLDRLSIKLMKRQSD